MFWTGVWTGWGWTVLIDGWLKVSSEDSAQDAVVFTHPSEPAEAVSHA